MKLELAAFSFLAILGAFVIFAVDRSMDELHQMFRVSVQTMADTDRRLERVEDAVSEIPEMKRQQDEIKKMLDAFLKDRR